MHPPAWNFAEMREASQVVLDSVLTDIDFGHAFLNIAETKDVENARRNVKNAIAALQAADKFLAEVCPAHQSTWYSSVEILLLRACARLPVWLRNAPAPGSPRRTTRRD